MKQPDHTLLCLANFQEEILRLKEAEFPYSHSKQALDRIEDLVKSYIERLRKLSKASPLILKQQCAIATAKIWEFLPILGFIIRSTNIRNSFEVYGPVLRMARSLLEPGIPLGSHKTKLLLSSEWLYSPFIYREFKELSDFVLIGLPAHESGNPLLIPLSGHEFGHRLWVIQKHRDTLRLAVEQEVISIITARWTEYTQAFPLLGVTPTDLQTNLFAIESYGNSIEWALKQLEETFCDFVGLMLFGKSYLFAYAYVASPLSLGVRSPRYPNSIARIQNLLQIASILNITMPPDFLSSFQDAPASNLSPGEKFQLKVADETAANLVSIIQSKAQLYITAVKLQLPPSAEEDVIVKRFRHAVPAENISNWVSILNAGWTVYEDGDFWKMYPSLYENKNRVLKELMLKNIEIFEIEQIIRETIL